MTLKRPTNLKCTKFLELFTYILYIWTGFRKFLYCSLFLKIIPVFWKFFIKNFYGIFVKTRQSTSHCWKKSHSIFPALLWRNNWNQNNCFIWIHLRNLHRKSTSVTFTTKQDKLVQDIKDTALFRVLLWNHYLPCILPHFWVVRLNRFNSAQVNMMCLKNTTKNNQKVTQE